MANKKSLEQIPEVPGLLSYRKDNGELYVNQGSQWQALNNKKEVRLFLNNQANELTFSSPTNLKKGVMPLYHVHDISNSNMSCM